jgi:putative endonuclease
MTAARQRMGRVAEDFVADRLARAGWKIVARNARSRHGELDIVAIDDHALVFVEVKAGRLGAAFGPERPILAIDDRKQRQVRRLAAAWLATRPDLPFHAEVRFDAVGVSFGSDGRACDYEHIQGAF